jgi:tagatose 6-phosphate kinase
VITVAGFNTAIDKALEIESLQVGEVNRARAVHSWPGGKGLHVALTIAALGEPVQLVGLIDRTHAADFQRFLSERRVDFLGIEASSEIRTNLTLRDAEGRVTELLEPGPQLEPAVSERLKSVFSEAARQASIAVVSGSVPRGMGESTYRDLIAPLEARAIRCLLDASGTLLRHGVLAQPFLAKPNRDEAEALLGHSIDGTEAALQTLSAIGAMGLSRVVLTLGRDGAVALWEGRRCRIVAPVIEARNPVGSGDCFVGGLAVGLERGLAPAEVLRLATACGAANALTAEIGILRPEDVAALTPKVEVEWIDAQP